jgi:hypothetical protein
VYLVPSDARAAGDAGVRHRAGHRGPAGPVTARSVLAVVLALTVLAAAVGALALELLAR